MQINESGKKKRRRKEDNSISTERREEGRMETDRGERNPLLFSSSFLTPHYLLLGGRPPPLLPRLCSFSIGAPFCPSAEEVLEAEAEAGA